MQRAQDEVPRLGGAECNLRCFSIADFADENHVRVLAQYGTQGDCKRETAFLVYGNLIGSAQFVFDGIFDGRDVDFPQDDFAEASVKRCRLAASGRACDEEQPLRSTENAADLLECRVAEIEARQRFCGVVCREQSQYAFFAVADRNGAQSYVHLFAEMVECKAPVVRQTAFRDIDIRHDFETDEYGFGKPLRKVAVFCQHAIDAVSHAECICHWLKMDVGRFFLERFYDKAIDEIYDGLGFPG